ncbi:glycoside hydrolase superfamily [Halenospora varia]|nr:glycoside hydrolase superfamily [Halenospora varia]
MKISRILTIGSTVATAAAQQVAYGQCGGSSWTGLTTCVTGYYCWYSNQWYSQCVPGTATSAGTTAATTSSTVVSSATSKPASTSTSAPAAAFTSFAKTAGSVFNINGKSQYFMGTNSYWIGFLTNNDDVDLVMSHLASTGLKVLRVWGFNDVTATPSSGTVWFQSFITGSSPVINTGADGLQRLDYVVSSAAAHGVSLIINFVNNWSDYGGMAAYNSYYGLSTTDPSQWYLSSAAQAQYQKYISTVVARYKDNKAVFAWELANEPRCTGCDTSIITNWVKTTSAYIKSLDSNHMVTLGDEGFGLTSPLSPPDTSYPFTTGPGLNWTANLAISTIDFGTYHLYPSSWGETDSWAPSWISAHAVAAAKIGKPIILEEYGSTNHTAELSWQQEVLNTQNAADMYWQYGDTFSWGKTHDDGYSLYWGTAEYATLVEAHAAAMLAKPVA